MLPVNGRPSTPRHPTPSNLSASRCRSSAPRPGHSRPCRASIRNHGSIYSRFRRMARRPPPRRTGAPCARERYRLSRDGPRTQQADAQAEFRKRDGGRHAILLVDLRYRHLRSRAAGGASSKKNVRGRRQDSPDWPSAPEVVIGRKTLLQISLLVKQVALPRERRKRRSARCRFSWSLLLPRRRSVVAGNAWWHRKW
jgi:hypothetical protein